jgi:hypothetical protein
MPIANGQKMPKCDLATRVSAALAKSLAFALPLALFLAPASAQEQQPATQAAAYYSEVDEQLTIRKVAILPVADNLDGIYGRPIEAQLIALAKADRHRDFVECSAEMPATLADLEESPAAVKKLAAPIEADALIAASAAKGPAGISIKLDLFLKSDGLMLAQESIKDYGRFDLADVKEQTKILYAKALSRLPYDGLVLSRQQNRVTINLGRADGLVPGQMLAVAQIIKVSRHPKFGFLVSSEKEIIGKIKALKIDEGLSFGVVASERDRGAIKRFAKISGLDSVNYPDTSDLSAAAGASGPQERADADVSFGKGATEWLPVRPPSFGQVGLKIGFGQYASSVNLVGVGDLEAKSSFYPQVSLYGEIWLNPNWQVRADVQQGVISTGNPRASSTPSTLNQSMSRYQLSFGRNFLLRDDFFGPKFQVSAGAMTYRMFVDDSQPLALTTATYSGFVIGIGGSLPLTDRKQWFAGGSANFVLFPALSESPATSGASSQNSINDFSLFVERKIGENIRGVGSIDFSLYGTSFSGTGSRTGPNGSETATTLSQRFASLNAGIAYLF